MKYQKVYDFTIQDEIAKGEKVWCLDKKDKAVFCVNSATFEFALKLIGDAKDDDRYEFWKEINEDA